MSDNQVYFQNKSSLFRTYILSDMSKSLEYANIPQMLDVVLVLADRVLATFRENMDFGRVWNIAEKLDLIEKTKTEGGNLSKVAEELLEDIELWLKTLLWIIDPVSWGNFTANEKVEKKFTLAPTIKALDLLTQDEFNYDIDTFQTITDPVHRSVLLAYRYRNPLTHSPRDWPEYAKAYFLPAVLTMLLAPLYKHYETIRTRLHALTSSPIEGQDVQGLLKLVNSERQGHLEHFAGRQSQIEELSNRLQGDLRESGRYLLLTGIEGMGKSALCAELTEVLTCHSQPLGRYKDEVKKIAPWLPSVIFHSGKQSKQPDEIMRLLLAQANTMLLSPIPLPSSADYVSSETVFEPEVSISSGVRVSNQGVQSSSRDSEIDQTYDLLDGRVGSSHSRQLILHRKSSIPKMEEHRRSLYLALAKVAQEYGPITMIIDAVDEISPDGLGLRFLPENLPKGVSALLTARQNTDAVSWIINNCHSEKVSLSRLGKEEIHLITKVNSGIGEVERKFNERVWVKSQGWPVLVIDAAKQALFVQGNLDAVQVGKDTTDIFERQAKEWEKASVGLGSATLVDLLLLLAIFEPVMPLSLGLVQGYLEFREVSLSQAELKRWFHLVGAQLEGLDVSSVKLGLKAFAEYIREQYCSHRDLRRVLETVVDWLSQEEDADGKIFSQFLQHWTDSNQITNDSLRKTAEKLLDYLIERKNGDLLYSIYLFSRGRRHKGKTLIPFALRCLMIAAELGNTNAMRVLGERLIDGVGVAKDVTCGEHWLRKAADAGELDAMVSIGERLIDGAGLCKNNYEGEQWLRKASSAGHIDARGILASRLLDGDGLDPHPVEGESILWELANEGNKSAQFILANRLIDGIGMAQNSSRGEELLRDIAQRGNDYARFGLAERLILGRGLVQDIDEGSILLHQLAEANFIPAMLDFGNRLIDGKGLERNDIEGVKWLQKAINAGNTNAMVNLGGRLLDGYGLGKQPKEGERLLRRAADSGDSDAMLILGQRLIKGKDIPKNVKEGEYWLRKAVEEDNVDAKVILGEELFNGRVFAKNTNEGNVLLREAANKSSLLAMVALGTRLLVHNGVNFSLDENTKVD